MSPLPSLAMLFRALPFAAVALGACAASPGMPSAANPPLTGPVWAWQSATTSEGQRVVASAPERYTIQFMPDGTVRVRADCNRGSGRYTAGPGRSLALGPVATTKMGCPDGTQDSLFLKALHGTGAYRFEGADLVLSAGTGTASMRFAAI